MDDGTCYAKVLPPSRLAARKCPLDLCIQFFKSHRHNKKNRYQKVSVLFYGNVAIHGYNAQRVAVCIPLAAGTPESGCISDFAAGEGNTPTAAYSGLWLALNSISKNLNHLQVPIAVLLQGNACKQ